MPDKPLEQACDARVCIHTDQILDSCMDKDCVEDLRVYLTRESQAALDRSTGAKTRCAELLFARVEVEPLAYKRGHYAVDLTFYYRILGDATVGGTRPVTITGLAVFTKRVALYGGRGKAKTFSSTDALPTPDGLLHDRLPVGVVEALDPMILASKVREALLAAAQHPKALQDPAPLVVLNNYQDSSIQYLLMLWTASGDYLDVRFAVNEAVKRELDARGIAIPYPQLDVHFEPQKRNT